MSEEQSIINRLDEILEEKKYRRIPLGDQPKYAIFGIGPYSFSPYKIGIPAFYKNPNFSLILTNKNFENKPIMVDDTCYFLSFNSIYDAAVVWLLLKSKQVKGFLNAIIFSEAKRPFTKEILQRLDLNKINKVVTNDEFTNLLLQSNIGNYIPSIDLEKIRNIRENLKFI